DLISQLLPIIDNFERALLSEYEKHNLSFFKEGILLIKKQFSDLLSERGLKEMDPLGKALDSNLHHALMQKSSEEYEENIIIEELQKGYLLYDKVIRPSQVVVSSGRNSGEGKKKEEE
ncbi:nucleotide exchange factor GrpE, partial [bacterium]|nr:nucleotide exchange factor GrpE [bacterium]